jgi:hypothetical protein
MQNPLTHHLDIWSVALQIETRDAIVQRACTPDGSLHFKHIQQNYAKLAWEDLCHDRLVLCIKPGDQMLRFDDIEHLLLAGWVVD